jgi:hypothetical protein
MSRETDSDKTREKTVSNGTQGNNSEEPIAKNNRDEPECKAEMLENL